MAKKAKDLFKIAHQPQIAEMHVDLSIIHDNHTNIIIETIQNLFQQDLNENEIKFICSRQYFKNENELNEILGFGRAILSGVASATPAVATSIAGRVLPRVGIKASQAAGKQITTAFGGQAARRMGRQNLGILAQREREVAAGRMTKILGRPASDPVKPSAFSSIIPNYSNLAARTGIERMAGKIGIGLRQAGRSAQRKLYGAPTRKVLSGAEQQAALRQQRLAKVKTAKRLRTAERIGTGAAIVGALTNRGGGPQGGSIDSLFPNNETSPMGGGSSSTGGGSAQGGFSAGDSSDRTGTVDRTAAQAARRELQDKARGLRSRSGSRSAPMVDNYILKTSKDVAIILNEVFDIPYDKQIIENIIKIVREKI